MNVKAIGQNPASKTEVPDTKTVVDVIKRGTRVDLAEGNHPSKIDILKIGSTSQGTVVGIRIRNREEVTSNGGIASSKGEGTSPDI